MKKTVRYATGAVRYTKQIIFWMGYILAFSAFLIFLQEHPHKDEIITLSYENEVQKLDLDSYITGVVLSEMPASFADEALKAQAVAARTFALKMKSSDKHRTFDICSDSGCCQGYISRNNYLAKGGKIYTYRRISEIVNETKNQVITYQGKLTEAPYFSCSGGWTESAVAVWGNDFPYLISKESPGEEESEHFQAEQYFSADEVRKRLGLSQDCSLVPSSVIYTDGKGVERISFGNREYSGVEFRSKMNLPSTIFTIEAEENGMFIQTKGFGHRVGLSQYGANAMAVKGCRYNQILEYYYPGTKIMKFDDIKKR